MVFKLLVFVSFLVTIQSQESSTPPPPSQGELGGTKQDRVAYFEGILNSAKPNQKEIFGDESPLLREVNLAFNKTVLTLVGGFLVHKSMLHSDMEECDDKAVYAADTTMDEAFVKTLDCLEKFRQRCKKEVKPEITDIRDVEDDLRAELIIAIDDCYEMCKTSTLTQFGQNTVDHLVCAKKLKL